MTDDPFPRNKIVKVSTLEKEYTLPVDYTKLQVHERRLVREQYIKLQKGLCRYCHAPLSAEPPAHIKKLHVNWSMFPPHFLKYPVHLHHHHDTGLTIGAVHALCNAVAWCYEGI
jgi:hypothetical protein